MNVAELAYNGVCIESELQVSVFAIRSLVIPLFLIKQFGFFKQFQGYLLLIFL